MLPSQRRQRRYREEKESQLCVGLLEERRVFHGGAAPPASANTLVTLDASNNLQISDIASGGKNDRISFTLSASGDSLEISDPNANIYTDITGATGSLSHHVSVPLAAVLGNRIFFDTGAGDDAVLIDFNAGTPGKKIDFQGGAGHDAIRVSGGSWQNVSLVMAHPKDISFTGTTTSGATQIIDWNDIEEVDDVTHSVSKTWQETSLDNLTLLDNGDPNDGILTLLAGFESFINFAQPSQNLKFVTQGGSDIIHGFDAKTPLNLEWDGATNNRFRIDGTLDLHGGSLAASFGQKMFIDGTIISHGGTVSFDAQNTGQLLVSSHVDVSNAVPGGQGGIVYLLGHQVTAFSGSSVNASGDAGGGQIFVGGSSGGLDRSITHSTETVLEKGIQFQADATQSGNGGHIVVWSDGSVYTLGSAGLSAQGGAVAGNGGLIETSAKRVVQIGNAANASATNGTAGVWQIEARDILVDSVNPANLTAQGRLLPIIDHTVLPGDTLSSALNAGTSVTLISRAGADHAQPGNITINQPLSATTAGNPVTVSLLAANQVQLNSLVSSANRTMNVNINAGADIRNGANGGISVRPGVGNVNLNAGGVIGDAIQPFSVEGGILTTHSPGAQNLISPSVVDVAQIDAGSSPTFFAGGEFHLLRGTITNLTVGNTATLSGAGTIQSLIAATGSAIRPGDAIGSVGVFTILGELHMERGSTLRLDINTPYVTAGIDYDQLIVGGQAFINSATLQLDGGQEVVKAIKPILLINVLNNKVATLGTFAAGAGSLDPTGEVHVGVVISRVFYNGNDGNDVILRDTNVVPGWGAQRQPDPLLRPVTEQRIVPPPMLSSSVSAARRLDDAPPREADAKQVRMRVLVISRLVPNAAGKGFQEQQLLRLNEEWLKNLADVFRRLPDDRYRVTLLLEGGESRRVMDVIIRDGRPFETEAAEPEEIKPPAASPKAESSRTEPRDATPVMVANATITTEKITLERADLETSANVARWLPMLAFSAAYIQRAKHVKSAIATNSATPRPLWRWVAREANRE